MDPFRLDVYDWLFSLILQCSQTRLNLSPVLCQSITLTRLKTEQ